MNSDLNSSTSMTFSTTKQAPQLGLHQAFNTFQNQFSAFLRHFSHHPLFKPSTPSVPDTAKRVLEASFSRPNSFSLPFNKNPVWASMTQPLSGGGSMSTEAIEERLAGIPVYALSNCNEEFVLVSGASNRKSLGLMCFKKEDAEALLEQMKSMDPVMRKEGSKVVPVALNKVCQLKVDGVAFRLIPETTQIKNALKEREKAGVLGDGISGVPVFQSRSLVLRSQNKSYRPVFFRKEDLEKSLQRASKQQNKLNPAFRKGDIQVAVFEEIIKGMKDGNNSTWNDVIFVPPGFDVSTVPTQP